MAIEQVAVFHTDAVQDRLVQKATEMLADHLQTQVSIKKASVSFIDQGVRLYGVEIEDRQQRKMFQMRELGVDIDLLRLFKNEVKISQANIHGLEARLYKPASDSDSVANYMFVINAFKRKKTSQDTIAVTGQKPKRHLNVDVSKVYLEDIKFSYNDTTNAQLGSLLLKSAGKERRLVELRELKTAFVKQTKKGPVANRLRVGILYADEHDGKVKLSVDSLCYQTDNHLPRKNVGKPKRGAFDAGHFDIVAKLSACIDSIGSDTLLATVNSCEAIDRGSGLAVKEMRLKVAANKRVAHLNDIVIKMANTSLSIPAAELRIVGYDKELIHAIDDMFARLEQSGDIQKLHDKWFYPENVHNDASPMALILLVAIVIAAIVVLLFSHMMRIKVKKAVEKSIDMNQLMTEALRSGNYYVIEYDIENQRLRNSYGDMLPKEGLSHDEFMRRLPDNEKGKFNEALRLMTQGEKDGLRDMP